MNRRALTRVVLVFLTILFAAALPQSGFAQSNPLVGSWKLNLQKSKYSAGPAPRSATLKYQAEGQNLKRTNEGTDAAGNSANNEWMNVFDGQPHPSPGPGYDASAYTRIDPNTFHFTRLKSAKIVQSGFGVLSGNGKTFTVTTIGTGPNGEQINNVAVYDKQ
jgi:hypothetical protein